MVQNIARMDQLEKELSDADLQFVRTLEGIRTATKLNFGYVGVILIMVVCMAIDVEPLSDAAKSFLISVNPYVCGLLALKFIVSTVRFYRTKAWMAKAEKEYFQLMEDY